MGWKVDFSINQGGDTSIFKLYGQKYYKIGSLYPRSGSPQNFLQFYIHDTDNEVSNRLYEIRFEINS